MNEKLGKTITINIPHGNLQEPLEITLSAWTGILYRIQRDFLSLAKKTDKLNGAGIYFLYGQDNDSSERNKQIAYVGQGNTRQNGKGVLARIKDHDKDTPKEKYWTEAIVLVPNRSDVQWGANEISYLEHHFVQVGQNACKENESFELKNNNTPNPGSDKKEIINELVPYIEGAEIVLQVLGYDFFVDKRIITEENSTDASFQRSIGNRKYSTEKKGSLNTNRGKDEISSEFPFKIGKVMLCAFREALATGLLKNDIKFLESVEAKKIFKTAGYQVIVSGEKPSKDAGGINRYAKEPVLFNGKKYWITTQSRKQGLPTVLQFLEQHGMPRARIEELCKNDKCKSGISVAENSNPQTTANKKTKYSLDGGTPLAMSQFVFLFVKEFCKKNSQMTFAELRDIFKDEFVESRFRKPGLLCDMEQIKKIALHNQIKRFGINNEKKRLVSSDGVIFYVNNQWTTQSFQNILKIAIDNGWSVQKIN